MRQPAWIRHRVMQTAPWRRRLFVLVAVSVLGTLLAGVTLALDGWMDALALYAACVLLLTLMLCHFAGQQMQPAALAKEGRADPGGRPAGLVLTGADRAAIPATLGNAPPLD